MSNLDVIKNTITVKRGKAFSATGSRPERWEYRGGCRATLRAHCDLCETEIVWQYPLVNIDDGKVLLIGSECVKFYYQSYMPNGLDRVLDMMADAYRLTKREVVDTKLAAWIAADKLHADVVAFLQDPASRDSLRNVYVTLPDGTGKRYSTSRYRASIKRKGYLRPDELLEIAANTTDWLTLKEAA